MDLMPTLIELAGAANLPKLAGLEPLPLNGISLVPAFHDEPLPPREYLAWRVPQHRALRVGY